MKIYGTSSSIFVTLVYKSLRVEWLPWRCDIQIRQTNVLLQWFPATETMIMKLTMIKIQLRLMHISDYLTRPLQKTASTHVPVSMCHTHIWFSWSNANSGDVLYCRTFWFYALVPLVWCKYLLSWCRFRHPADTVELPRPFELLMSLSSHIAEWLAPRLHHKMDGGDEGQI